MPGLILALSAALSLQDEKSLEETLREFNRQYSSPDSKIRAAAVEALSKAPHEKTLRRLIPLVTADGREVRLAAARALGSFKDQKKQVVPTLAGALSSNAKDPDVQVAILEALGKLQDEAALPAVHQAFRGPQIKVAKAALAAAGAIRGKDSLSVLLELLRDLQKWQRTNQSGGFKDESVTDDPTVHKARIQGLTQETLKALQAITREPWATPGEWEVWSRRHLASFTVPK